MNLLESAGIGRCWTRSTWRGGTKQATKEHYIVQPLGRTRGGAKTFEQGRGDARLLYMSQERRAEDIDCDWSGREDIAVTRW